jgi:hypothetical protein
MAGLSSKDGASGRQVRRVGDERSGAEVSGSANALDGLGESRKALGVGVGELVGAGRDGVLAERTSEERDVAGLVLRDLHKAVANPRREAGLLECLGVKLGEHALVHVVLKVLEGERILEDDSVYTTVSGGKLKQGNRDEPLMPAGAARRERPSGAGAAAAKPARARAAVTKASIVVVRGELEGDVEVGRSWFGGKPMLSQLKRLWHLYSAAVCRPWSEKSAQTEAHDEPITA